MPPLQPNLHSAVTLREWPTVHLIQVDSLVHGWQNELIKKINHNTTHWLWLLFEEIRYLLYDYNLAHCYSSNVK